MAANGNGVWKWIAAILASVLLAGAPGVIQAIKAPSQEEVNEIREQQAQMLIRLAVIEAQLHVNEALLNDLQRQLHEHEAAAAQQAIP